MSLLPMQRTRPNHAMEPTPPDLIMISLAVPPSMCSQPRALGGVARLHRGMVRCAVHRHRCSLHRRGVLPSRPDISGLCVAPWVRNIGRLAYPLLFRVCGSSNHFVCLFRRSRGTATHYLDCLRTRGSLRIVDSLRHGFAGNRAVGCLASIRVFCR
jgi:hypothetical protein